MEMIENWFAIADILEKTKETGTLKTYACMLLDFVASKSGKATEELINELLPFIREVNSKLGAMEI